MEKYSKIFVTGHNGLVGKALVKELTVQGYANIVTAERKDLDLCCSASVDKFFKLNEPEYVFNCAGKVGGIYANDNYGGDFIRENLQISVNVIESCRKYGVKKLCYLGSSCIYPKLAQQPIKESELLTGPLEESNIGYALAKISGMAMCRLYNKQYGTNFISVMPTNLYGENDNFSTLNSHVLPGMLDKFHRAKMSSEDHVELWGDGTPLREFLYVGDLAKALVFLIEEYDGPEHVNVGTGEEVSIRELADTIKEIVGFIGEVWWNADFKNGTPRKLLDVTKLHELGWKHETSLHDGIKATYDWYLENYKTLRR